MGMWYLLACAGLPTGRVNPAGAARQLEVNREITIDAPANEVWAVCGDFGAIERWLSAVKKTTLSRGEDNAVGAVRHLDVKGGGTVDEELLAYSVANHSLAYRILSGMLPVSDYRSDFAARDLGQGRTVVTWSSTFRRKDTGSNPAADANDEAALAAITRLYETGLADLKRAVEAG